MSEHYAGRCLCGAVRYVAEGPPLTVRMCYCRVCQYFACGNAAVQAGFKTEAVKITGTLKDYVSIADSGTEMHRRFCAECGVQVTTSTPARSHMTMIRVGTLDEPQRVKPVAAIWTASAPLWACIDPELTQFEHQPPPL